MNMIFYLNNGNGTGYSFRDKETFLKHLEEAIEYRAANGATYLDCVIESDEGFSNKGEKYD